MTFQLKLMQKRSSVKEWLQANKLSTHTKLIIYEQILVIASKNANLPLTFIMLIHMVESSCKEEWLQQDL